MFQKVNTHNKYRVNWLKNYNYARMHAAVMSE